MTAKDYNKVASIIAGLASDPSHSSSAAAFANEMADFFQGDNPRFDRGRFLKASGVTLSAAPTNALSAPSAVPQISGGNTNLGL